MKISEVKIVKKFCGELHCNPDWREVINNIELGNNDFEVDNVRFVHTDHIQSALEDYLASDCYVLGSFNAWAISKATGWPTVLIEAAQKGEAFEQIGEAMTGEQIANLAEIYAREDGYGHAFNGYDFGEDELEVNGQLFHVFDNH